MSWISIYIFSYIRYFYKYFPHRYPQLKYLENFAWKISNYEYLQYLKIFEYK